MKIFNETMNIDELDAVSGGTYKEYIDISNAIAKRIADVNKNDPTFSASHYKILPRR